MVTDACDQHHGNAEFLNFGKKVARSYQGANCMSW